jgi:hypothetical protein
MKTNTTQATPTTFSAIERGLGLRLDWWIATDDRLAVFRFDAARGEYLGVSVSDAPDWLDELRRVSGVTKEE